MLEGLPIVRQAFSQTVRLVPSARLRPPVLQALVPPEDIEALAEIEGATSARLMGEARGTEGVAKGEFLHGIPYAALVNAAFAYAKPLEPNRFNAARGAWYCALDVTTCVREVAYHMADFLAKSGELKGVVEYAEMFASMAGEFVDLKGAPTHPCLDPDPAIGYPIGNAIADAARAQGSTGTSILLFGTPTEPASSLCGRMRCNRSRPAPSIGLHGLARSSPRSSEFPSSHPWFRHGCPEERDWHASRATRHRGARFAAAPETRRPAPRGASRPSCG
jgi:RES domain